MPQQLVRCSTVDVEKIRQIVHILCITTFQDVTPRELDVLCEFVMFDYSKEAKNSFILNYNTTEANFNQIIKRLTDKGILLPKPYKSGKTLHPDFKKLKELYVDQKNDFLIVQVNNA
jgi:hypothetical protein